LEYFHWRKVLFVVERSARAALRAEFEICAASQEAYQQEEEGERWSVWQT
jgi:hypothetical protein